MLAALRRHAWLRLAGRHLEMARLLVSTHADGAFFHVYHAFESLVCSELLRLAPAEPIPDGHRDRYDEFLAWVTEPEWGGSFSALWSQLDRRNEALYVGWRGGSVREPHQCFDPEPVGILIGKVDNLLEQARSR